MRSSTKRALTTHARVGSVVTYEIVVRNAGTAAAANVVVLDQPAAYGQLTSAHAGQGDCNDRTPAICRVGTLAAGQRVTIRVRARAIGAPTMTNVAVAGSGTLESRLANNLDSARIHVRETADVVGKCSAAGPIAQAAC